MQLRQLLPTDLKLVLIWKGVFSAEFTASWIWTGIEKGRNLRKDLQLMRVNTKQNLYKLTMITAPACSRPRKYRLGLAVCLVFVLYILAVDTGNPRDKNKILQDD